MPVTTKRDELWWADEEMRGRIAADPIALLQSWGVTVPPDLPNTVLQELIRLACLLWVDGKIIPRDQFRIDPFDEGLLYGRGAWETTRTINGLPWLWSLHTGRILHTAKALGFTLDANRIPDDKTVQAYVRAVTSQEVVVRLNVSAGRKGSPGVVWMSLGAPPLPRESVRLKTVLTPVIPGYPELVWKTFQYGGRMRASSSAIESGYDSALLVDTHNHLLESSNANIFLRFADGWKTPRADLGLLLPGTVRQYLLQFGPVQIEETTIPLDRLGEVREVFLTGSSIGIVPVSQINQHQFLIGEETRHFQQWLFKRSS